MTSLNEAIVEDAALTWFGELGYAVGHGPQLAPGEPAAERSGGWKVGPANGHLLPATTCKESAKFFTCPQNV